MQRPGTVLTIAALLMASASLTGCRARTQLIEDPRVDLNASTGNRGYLLGTAPASAGSWKTTRQMFEAEVETPAWSRPGRTPTQSVNLEEIAPPEMEPPSTAPAGGSQPSSESTTYSK